MNLNQAIEWGQEFVDAEWALTVMHFTEMDSPLLHAKACRPFRKHLAELVAEGVAILDVLPTGPHNAQDWAMAKEKLATHRKREILAATRGHSTKLGEIFTFYVSDTRAASDVRPADRLHAAIVNGEVKIVAWDAFCSMCMATGKFYGKRCGDCQGRGWHGYRGNLALGSLSVKEIRILRRTVGRISDMVFATLGG